MVEMKCTQEVVPCELSRFAEVSEDRRCKETEWVGLVFEGDVIDSELFIHTQEADITEGDLDTEDGKIRRTEWFTKGWWEECMSFKNRQTVAQYKIDLVNVRSGVSTIDGRTREEIEKERSDQEIALALLGDGKCAKVERQSDDECVVLSVGSIQFRESDVCKDCTEGEIANQKQQRGMLKRYTDIRPHNIMGVCIHGPSRLKLYGLTRNSMWIRNPHKNIDHLLEYRLI